MIDVEREWKPRILGIGGTTRQGSSSERALRIALDLAERAGAETDILLAETWSSRRTRPNEGRLGRRPAACWSSPAVQTG